MLKVIAFLGGAVLMGLEFVAQRSLAPFFGNSIYVWGSIISMVLAALSLGYYFGGKLADRYPDLRFLVWVLAAVGALLFWVPIFTPTVASSIVDSGLGTRAGSLVASLALFFVPSVLLGTVSPYAVKLAATSLSTLGNTAGSMSAVSNAGSIVGSLVTSFVLISWLGVRSMFFVFGGVLLLLAGCVLAYDTWRRSRIRGESTGATGTYAFIGLAVLTLVAVIGPGATPPVGEILSGISTTDQVVYETDSAYHHIVVVDSGGERYLRFDDSWQSGMFLSDPAALLFDYTKYFHLALLFSPEPERALFVGLGGGSVPKNFRKSYPALSMDVAEIDPEVIRVAQTYFGVQPDENLSLYALDGRTAVRGATSPYDMIFLDAYYSDSIPHHLTTVEFARQVQSALSPGGVVVSNVIGSLAGEDSRLFRSMLKTYQDVFRRVYVFAVGLYSGSADDTRLRNLILIATDDADRSTADELEDAAARMWEEGTLGLDVRPLVRSYVDDPISTDGVPLLTDDFAPVDALLPVGL